MTASQLLNRVYEMSPDRPLRTLWRSAGYALRPPRPGAFQPRVDRRQRRLLDSGMASGRQLARVHCEQRSGPQPTIVLGGFVPDAAESVYLQRGMLLRHGSVYYFSYPPHGFSSDLLFAQLDDLLEELAMFEDRTPVVMGVSFGCGLLLEWMRHARRADRRVNVRGVVLVSPVSCPDDIVEAGTAKPSTLLGRALLPFLAHEGEQAAERHVEKCRALLLRMFESGAQNKRAIREVMTQGELQRIRHRVVSTLKEVSMPGAVERVVALARMEAPDGAFTQMLAPLCEAPVLVLFAEKESSVLVASSPTAACFAQGAHAVFPTCEVHMVRNRRGSPVQHASLLFHSFNFHPLLAAFYRRLRRHVAIQRARSRRGAVSWITRGLARALGNKHAA